MRRRGDAVPAPSSAGSHVCDMAGTGSAATTRAVFALAAPQVKRPSSAALLGGDARRAAPRDQERSSWWLPARSSATTSSGSSASLDEGRRREPADLDRTRRCRHRCRRRRRRAQLGAGDRGGTTKQAALARSHRHPPPPTGRVRSPPTPSPPSRSAWSRTGVRPRPSSDLRHVCLPSSGVNGPDVRSSRSAAAWPAPVAAGCRPDRAGERVHAVDVAHERRVDAVAEQRPDAVGVAPCRRRRPTGPSAPAGGPMARSTAGRSPAGTGPCGWRRRGATASRGRRPRNRQASRR